MQLQHQENCDLGNQIMILLIQVKPDHNQECLRSSTSSASSLIGIGPDRDKKCRCYQMKHLWQHKVSCVVKHTWTKYAYYTASLSFLTSHWGLLPKSKSLFLLVQFFHFKTAVVFYNTCFIMLYLTCSGSFAFVNNFCVTSFATFWIYLLWIIGNVCVHIILLMFSFLWNGLDNLWQEGFVWPLWFINVVIRITWR